MNEPTMLYPGGIATERRFFFELGRKRDVQTVVIAAYGKDELVRAIAENGRGEVALTGKFRTGRYFTGADSLQVHAWPPRRNRR
jgi:hypothetical protein